MHALSAYHRISEKLECAFVQFGIADEQLLQLRAQVWNRFQRVPVLNFVFYLRS